jgi:hypothetical protein
VVDAGRDDVPLVQNAMALRHLWLTIDRIHRGRLAQAAAGKPALTKPAEPAALVTLPRTEPFRYVIRLSGRSASGQFDIVRHARR